MRFRSLLAAVTGLSAASACVTPARSAPAPPVVTLLGDSITAGLGLRASQALPAQLQAALARLGVQVLVSGAGLSGDTSAGGLARVDFSVSPDTRLCIVELGANDYLQSLPPADTRRNLDALVARLKGRHIRVLLLGGVAPVHSSGGYGEAFDAVFPAVARAQGVPLQPDFLKGVEADPRLKQSDGLHPNAAGVALIAAHMAPYVAKALQGHVP